MNPTIILWAYTITMFISATLLFLVQPIIGKILIPFLGGAPSVWNTCMVFFQAVLLLGYLYAHGMSKLHPKRQLQIHLVILIVTGLTLPITSPSGVPPQDAPLGWLLLALVGLIGAPFFAVSTTAPLLQSWFSHSTHPTAKDPYHLYAASNLGSMTSLLGYPFLIEPFAKLQTQTLGWSVGFGVFAISVVLCGVLLTKSMAQPASDTKTIEEDVPAPSIKEVGTWILLAFLPSSLVLGTTTYITTDVGSIPLLWLVPLALYLLTFILVFSNRITLNTNRLTQMVIIITLFACMLEYYNSGNFHMFVLAATHMALLFIFALTSHALLAERRPHVKHLTAFFLWMSFGGVLGGAFNALLAPFIFDTLLEYWLVMAASIGVFVWQYKSEEIKGWPGQKTSIAFAIVVTLAFFISSAILYQRFQNTLALVSTSLMFTIAIGSTFLIKSRRPKHLLYIIIALTGLVLHYRRFYMDIDHKTLTLERSFFGTHRVAVEDGRVRLHHGTTSHGVQHIKHPTRSVTYYSEKGPLGDLFRRLKANNRMPKHSAVIGLGAGCVALYASPTHRIDFYEIDPVVSNIAKNPKYFTYLKQCGDQCKVIIGDGRLMMQHKAKPNSLDMLLFDAYSSDAIPLHLTTREAFEVYWSKIKSDGFIVLHISNRYFDLRPVLAKLAQATGAKAYVYQYVASKEDIENDIAYTTTWMVMGKPNAKVDDIFGKQTPWKRVHPRAEDQLWTDSYANLFEAFYD